MKGMGFKCNDNSSSGKKRISKNNHKGQSKPKKQCDWVISNKNTSDSASAK
jgi:hypothetical protein